MAVIMSPATEFLCDRAHHDDTDPLRMDSESLPDTKAAPLRCPRHALRLWAWRMLGTISVGIGFINVFIPLLPTTVFLIIGAWAWGKGAPELKARLLDHPRFGPSLRDWENGRRISRRGKRVAILSMIAAFELSALIIGAKPAILIVGACLLAVGLWLWHRPEPAEDKPS